MMIDSKAAKGGSSVFEKTVYFFCSPKCKTKFDEEPLKYLVQDLSEKSQSASVEFTCPMHPDIRQIGPGSCPICGMALEPVRAL